MKAVKKHITLAIIFFSLRAAFPFAPGDSVSTNNEEVIDIRAMVQSEMDNARLKQNNLIQSFTLTNKIKIENAGITSSGQEGFNLFSYFDRVDTRIIILASVFILSSVLIAFRRIRYAKKRFGNNELSLKRKISMIRDEEPIFSEDSELSEVRKNLRYASMLYDRNTNANKEPIINVKSVNAAGGKETEKNISITARQLQIAKGEILLASKIRALELENA